MTAPAALGLNVINNHIAKWAPSRHDDALLIPHSAAPYRHGCTDINSLLAAPSAREQTATVCRDLLN
jgi:hypothetical protein